MNKKHRIIDGELVLYYQSGNDKALTLLVKRWHKIFCNKAYWIIKDADVSKDIAQESWKTIIDKIDTLKDPSSFGSWALRIVYTKSLDWIKNANKDKQNQEAYNYQQSVNEEKERYDVILKKALLKAIQSLPEHQQMVIRLFYVQDYSLKQISDILNISIGTTKSRLFHAREKIKLILKNRNYEK